MAFAWNSCFHITRLWTCSPVATLMGAIARAMAAWPRMSSGLVGSSIHIGSHLRQGVHPLDGLGHAPDLVRIDHQLPVGADDLPGDTGPAQVVLEASADLELEVREAIGERLLAQPPDLVVVVAQPARGGGVRGVPGRLELGDPLGLAGFGRPQDVQRLVRRQRVGQVAEVDEANELLGGHARHQAPQGHAAHLGEQVPDRIEHARPWRGG